MWLTTFTTRRGDICLRFGSRGVNVTACAAAKGVAELVKRHPNIAGATAILLPIMIQLYLASRDKIEEPQRSPE